MPRQCLLTLTGRHVREVCPARPADDPLAFQDAQGTGYVLTRWQQASAAECVQHALVVSRRHPEGVPLGNCRADCIDKQSEESWRILVEDHLFASEQLEKPACPAQRDAPVKRGRQLLIELLRGARLTVQVDAGSAMLAFDLC